MVFTIVGTLSHEIGHIAVAKYFDYETYLSYGSMYHLTKGYKQDKYVVELEQLEQKFQDEGITNLEELDENELDHYNNLVAKIQGKFPNNKAHDLWITIGGPAQTILMCLIGLFMLYVRKSKQRSDFKILDWLGVFLGLFILREVFNTVMAIFTILISGSTQFYGDEFRISSALDLNQWVVPILTMLIGLAVSMYIIFKIVPLKYWFTFIVSGFIGGVLGYGIWFGFLGELLFPDPISF
ncbi:hypothetical protein [Hanstruepera marina]|uniref:hypothetical protein n=1 Tax=Hanstruepera marina TaxID=2873265 RepID=UPI001CA699D5|nr:hypothetical protein [Hanstruepera marina]